MFQKLKLILDHVSSHNIKYASATFATTFSYYAIKPSYNIFKTYDNSWFQEHEWEKSFNSFKAMQNINNLLELLEKGHSTSVYNEITGGHLYCSENRFYNYQIRLKHEYMKKFNDTTFCPDVKGEERKQQVADHYRKLTKDACYTYLICKGHGFIFIKYFIAEHFWSVMLPTLVPLLPWYLKTRMPNKASISKSNGGVQ